MSELISHYRLKGKQPVPCKNVLEWGRWFARSDEERRVAQDSTGEARVSTVFLGIDHNLVGNGPPLLFETMISGGELDGEQWRCSTWEEAEAAHLQACVEVRVSIAKYNETILFPKILESSEEEKPKSVYEQKDIRKLKI